MIMSYVEGTAETRLDIEIQNLTSGTSKKHINNNFTRIYLEENKYTSRRIFRNVIASANSTEYQAMPFSIFITSWFTDKAAKSETKSTLRWSIDQTSRKQRSPVEQRNFAYQQRQNYRRRRLDVICQ
ncbi:uncharacterized protein LOC122566161 isoform X2 [Bombus pyrosoma]|uniref:uncharacterized protein LOC122566161 isoform X2 n=1 Tax=Bombus pyrosoma TaxID=396416 RepID=UPI001CB94674|nr:uncharacterized protein LOC122566161 isoform X2 [Bombus pyrosoma]